MQELTERVSTLLMTLRPGDEDFRLTYSLTDSSGALVSSLRGSAGLFRPDDREQPHAILGPDKKPLRGVGKEVYRDEYYVLYRVNRPEPEAQARVLP